jgi:hypothetical protein
MSLILGLVGQLGTLLFHIGEMIESCFLGMGCKLRADWCGRFVEPPLGTKGQFLPGVLPSSHFEHRTIVATLSHIWNMIGPSAILCLCSHLFFIAVVFSQDVVPARPAWYALFHLNAFFWRFDIPIDWGERGSDRETLQGSDDVKQYHLLLPRMGGGTICFLTGPDRVFQGLRSWSCLLGSIEVLTLMN